MIFGIGTDILKISRIEAVLGRHGDRFASRILGRDWDYVAYTPPGYDETRDLYPVVYMLHGACGAAAVLDRSC